MTIACFLDLEMNKPCNSIIQVGYVIVDLRTGNVKCMIRDNVTLPFGEVDPRIEDLTGISNEELLMTGSPLIDIFEKLCDTIDHTGCFRHIFTWGSGDVPLLLSQVKQRYDGIPERLQDKVYYQHFDVKKLYQMWALENATSIRCGLEKALDKLGMRFDGIPHDALYDALNTWRIYHQLSSKLKETY